METISNQYEIRNAISDLVCNIDIAEMQDKDKLSAIDYAIKMLNEIKEEIEQGR